MKPVIKKTLSIVLVALLLLLAFAPSNISFNKGVIVQGENGFYQMQSFTNDRFNTELDSVAKQTNLVNFSELYEIISANFETDTADATIKTNLEAAVDGKKVAINTPDDLYNLSASVSFNYTNPATAGLSPKFNSIQYLLSLDYILMNDIDYSIMKAKQFLPIGFDLSTPYDIGGNKEFDYPFTGTFDGNGFTITNLYLAEYDYITMISANPADLEMQEEVVLTPYYAMFAHVAEGAIVCNLNIKDPIIDLRDIPDGLKFAANLVGENSGTVYNCSVVDKRVNANGQDQSGLSWTLPQGTTTSETFQAAGLVHTNLTTGKIYNSYYVSGNVVNPSCSFRFDTKPVIFNEGGTIDGVAYNTDLVSEEPQTSGSINNYSVDVLESGVGVNINNFNVSSLVVDTNTSTKWHFFADDCLPTMEGLSYNDSLDAFEISTDRDLMIFSKILSRISKYNEKNYVEHNYVIKNNIDMTNYQGYVPPKEEFKGHLFGADSVELGSSKNTNKVISNLVLSNPYSTEEEIYYGLLTKCSGTVSNLNFSNCEIQIQKNDEFVSKKTYAGIVCGKLLNGTVEHVLTNSTITNPDNGAIGEAYIGGVVGYGNGLINKVANLGDIDLGSDLSFAGLTVNAQYQIGGILGGSSESGLTLKDAINEGNITGLGTTAAFTSNLGKIEVAIGGIIGQLNNSTSTNNSVYLVTNDGTISSNRFDGTASQRCYVYVSGIIGNVIGKSGELGSGSQVLNGQYENNGLIKYYGDAVSDYATIYNAGILVASTSTYSYFSYMTNNGVVDSTRKNYDLAFELKMNSANNNSRIYYAATVIDNSSAGITLSRAYNEFNFVYSNSYFTSGNALIGPFFTSVSNNRSKLLYCTNNGDLSVVGTSVIATTGETRIAGITQSYNVDYENIYVSGNITVGNFKQGAHLYVAGIGWILPYCNEDSPNYAKNCLNEGKIVTYNIQGETTITGVSGTGSTDTNFAATTTAHNLYVGGLFNLNVGNLTNSMNRADITSLEGSNSEIAGTCNTFVGGLVTYNYNLIQDCANSGNIMYTNSSTGTTYVAGGDTPNSLFGGMIFAYNGGLALGGVCSALADTEALILKNGSISYGYQKEIDAQILDSSNNGNVFGKANQYVRSGGVLAVALGVEITAGNDSTAYTYGANNNTAAKTFSNFDVGSQDSIADSLLSNGLNFGNICAITNKIGNVSYSGPQGGNQGCRPGIYSCAGGVIAYGLCKMNRMINHGVVSSCDVAGGVIGATYILGTPDSEDNLNITLVDINTAVHYGKVKAAKYARYSTFNYDNMDDYDNNTYYYPDNDTSFVFAGYSSALNQGTKRGFGGIFGRLQRGNRGLMQSKQFNNILNMDPYVDMIGRADGSGYTAYMYYRFADENLEDGDIVYDTYYSARTNDTTPCVVVGHSTGETFENTKIVSATSVTYTIERTRNGNTNYYYVRAITVNGGYGEYTEGYFRNVQPYIDSDNITYNAANGGAVEVKNVTSSNTFTTLEIDGNIEYDDFGFTYNQRTQIQGLYSNNETGEKYYTITSDYPQYQVTEGGGFWGGSDDEAHQVEIVTDDPANTDYTYIFADDFPLMDPEQTNFIYQANNDVLADRFRLSDSENYKPNGMYVLASTKGRDAGAVLPANLKINNLYKLKEVDGYVDLGNIQSNNLVNDETSNTDLLNDYRSMFQIRFSDKSLIMHQETDAKLYDIVLEDKNGNGPTLTNGKVNDNNKTITFTVSQDAFKSGSVEYIAKSAELSENAVIAKSGMNSSTYAGFHQAYVDRTSNILTGTYLSSVTGTIDLAATADVTYTLTDTITVYSEIACQVSGLAETYKTDYTIIIVVETTAIVLDLNNTQIDGVNIADPNGYTTGAESWTYPTTQPVSQNGTLSLTMDDVNSILPLNHELICTGLYYNGTTEVLEDYYEITTTGKTDADLMTIAITLSDDLINGNYQFRFKYYSNVDKEYLVTFTKAASTDYTILDVTYDSYSQTDNINDTTFVEKSVDFETYIGFDVLFGGVSAASGDPSQEVISNGVTEPYLNNVEAYQLMIGSTDVATIKLAPFATLTSWSISSEYDVDGNFVQTLTYNVSSANNDTASIVHTIMERSLPSMTIYKDGVIQLNNSLTEPVKVKRESLLTEIFIDFGFPNGNSNSNVTYEIGYVDPTNDDASISDADVKAGITQDANTSYYILNVLSDLEPSVIGLDLSLERAAGVSKKVGTIYIEKLEGTNAYLQDIQFQLSENASTVYPTFAEADEDGIAVENSIYDIRGYYAGIDYDGADNNTTTNFIIDGKVANEDLENYCPIFTLPIGATVQRITRDDTGNETGRYDDLYANYLGVDDGSGDYIAKPIIYEIVSEDGLNKVYYYISVSDLLYNLTLRFNIYFRTADNKIVKASDSSSLIKDNIVVINVVNYELDSNTTYDIGENGEYPFETIDNGNSTVTIKDYIVGKYNQSTLFYAPVNESNYLYTFGRNRSGCYKFNVITPIYNGTASEKLVNGARFNYDIYFGKLTDDDSNGIYDTPTGKQLPDFDNTKDYVGKYFFIEDSTRNRIRYFSIIIDCSTGDDSWGLTDDDSTWN